MGGEGRRGEGGRGKESRAWPACLPTWLASGRAVPSTEASLCKSTEPQRRWPSRDSGLRLRVRGAGHGHRGIAASQNQGPGTAWPAQEIPIHFHTYNCEGERDEKKRGEALPLLVSFSLVDLGQLLGNSVTAVSRSRDWAQQPQRGPLLAQPGLRWLFWAMGCLLHSSRRGLWQRAPL